MMMDFVRSELDRLQRSGLLRAPRRMDSAAGPHVSIDGREIISLCSNDYLGLAWHPALVEAARSALERFGFGSGASRLISGNTALHEELETRIAAFKGTESSILFNSGYAANTGIIPALVQEGNAVLSDELNHASIIDGCRLSKASINVYRHKDMNHLEYCLRLAVSNRRRLIITDGVFSMDGDIAPLDTILDLAEKYGAVVLVDDAHAAGVLGKTGKGTSEHFHVEERDHIRMGTLGKAFGSFGAYVAGSRELTSYVLNKARSFMFSTSLPPAVCAASIAAIELLGRESWRIEKLRENRQRLYSGLQELGMDTGLSETAIIPVICGDAASAVRASERLFELGVFAPAIRPPSVPEGSSRIRTTITAAHSEADIDEALASFRRLRDEGYLGHVKRK